MPIIPQNNSLLSNAAASILGGKQIVSLDNTDDIRSTAVAYVEVIAPFCGDGSSKEIEKAITTSEKTIKTVFVNGITFEFDKKTFAVYVVNSYDLSQLQNFYGDVNGAELPSGYFVVVVPISEVKADALKGNVATAAAPEVLNVDTGKAIKESAIRVGDMVQGIQGVDRGYKGKVKRLTRDSRGRQLVVFVDDKGLEREAPVFNVKAINESAEASDLNGTLVTLNAALKYGKHLEGESAVETGDLQHLKTLISKGLSQLNANGKVQKYKLGAISSGLSQIASMNDLGDILNYLEGDILTISNAAGVKEANVSERTMSVTYAQAISALAGSAEDEDISVLKRYADCMSIIFRMTPKEVMNDLLPEDDTYKAKSSDKVTAKMEIGAKDFKYIAPKAYAKLNLTDKSIVQLEYFTRYSLSDPYGIELVRVRACGVRVGNTLVFTNTLTGMDPMEYKKVAKWIHEVLADRA